MQSPNKLMKVLRTLAGNGPLPQVDEAAALMAPHQAALTTQQRDKIIATIGTTRPVSARQPADLLTHLRTTTRTVGDRRAENEQIMQMAPEVSMARVITIPSIMAPNDMRDGVASVACDAPSLTNTQRERLSKELSRHFNDVVKLSAKLPGWIDEMLYGAGSQPVLILPVSELDRQFNDPTGQVKAGTESYRDALLRVAATESLFGVADNAAGAPSVAAASGKGRATANPLLAGVESLLADAGSLVDALAAEKNGKAPEKPSYNRAAGERATKAQRALEALQNDFLGAGAMAVLDNPDFLKAETAARSKTKRKVKQSLQNRYRPSSTVVLQTPGEGDPVGNPTMLEVPPEAVVPLFPPGRPDEHIGYFLIADETGNFINIHGAAHRVDQGNVAAGLKTNFDTLFSAYGLNSLDNMASQSRMVMANIYQRIVENHLQSRLNAGGFGGLQIGTDGAVFQAMFARYLEQKQTRLLFVPRELLVYYAFRYNQEDGTGRSKLEDIKFILSLRITLLVCRMMSSMNAAIDRRKLVYQADGNTTNAPLELVNSVHRAALEKMQMNFTWLPDEIARSITSKSLTVKVTGINGMENFDITNEANPRDSAGSVDEQLVDDLRNLMGLVLEVPPSALNNLSENEYARSLATTNLIFSRNIQDKQNVVCAHSTELVQTYTRYSADLHALISRILGEGSDGAEKADGEGKDTPNETIGDSGTVTTATVEAAVLEEIIANLKVTLPRPDIAPDKAQFETLDAFTNSLNSIIDSLFPDDLANGDPDLIEALAAQRALAKADVYRDYMVKHGMTSIELPRLSTITPKGVLDIRQSLINLRAGIDEQKKYLRPEAAGSGY